MKALVFIGSALACAAAFAGKPAATTSFPLDWPHRVPWKLNRELLLPVNKRIVFLVDTQRGSSPLTLALDQLVALASKYGGRPASWITLGEPGAPDVKWVDLPTPTKPVTYYVRLRDGQILSDFHIPQDDVSVSYS